MYLNVNEETRHYEEAQSAPEAFARDLQSLVAVIEEMKHNLEEECLDLLVSDPMRLPILQ